LSQGTSPYSVYIVILGVVLGLMLGINFQTGMLFQDQENMIQEHVLLGKITVANKRENRKSNPQADASQTHHLGTSKLWIV